MIAIRFRGTVYHAITHNSYTKTRFDKGLYGEYLTYINLQNIKGPHKFLFNVYLPKGNGETTEIDVLLLHTSGIYVFESKNYSGWIFGTENQRQWTQSLPRGRSSVKEHFLNPIMQNKLHIKWLKELLKQYEGIPYHSIILFSDRCELKKIELTTKDSLVLHRSAVALWVNKKALETGTVLNEAQIEEIYQILYPGSQVSEDVKRHHIENITRSKLAPPAPKPVKPQPPEPAAVAAEAAVSAVQPPQEAPICPRCGSALVLRTAKSGARAGKQFWGCSGYPKCRYVENIGE